MSNPFDFSDFGAAGTPSAQPGPGPAPAAPLQQGAGGPGHFDPWANQPSAPAAPAAAGPAAPDPGGLFGAGAAPGIGAQDGRDAFGHLTINPTGPGALTTSGPPLVWFAVAIALAVGGALLSGFGALQGGNIGTALAGWLLAGPVAIGALAVFNRVDTRRRTDAIYSAPSWTATLYWVVLALCLVGIVVGAWQIALWAGTL
ncbi:hypothetical protein KIH27_08935 [Mycobacterium sp. M1]|uniref:DUF4190 domain-containing protein n=1 Tax=Mycolicibacter acidiphilus TaxID=2835306 RepID=A0ABS5RJC1_9MYCO|nr:hypothetical protein [Mycolicibacter acidiphilus]MBS9533709.1 hypothetical protein [Mycolicibacter acidiphilus]